MKYAHLITWILIIVGGLNWGLVGLGMLMTSDWNVIHMVLGSMPMVEGIVYLLVGLSAVYEIVMHRKNCKMCGGASMGSPAM